MAVEYPVGSIVRGIKDSLILTFSLQAVSEFKAVEKANVIAEESFSVLRYSYGLEIPMLDYRYLIEDKKRIGRSYTRTKSVKYIPENDRIISDLAGSIRDTKRLDIERRIKNAVYIFGIQKSMPYPEVRLTLLCTALEGLLGSEADEDCLTVKIAEKTCFLVGQDSKDRRDIYDFVKAMYAKRCDFAHHKEKRRKVVAESDLISFENLVYDTISKLFVIGYEQIDKRKDTPNITEYIEELKFQ